jgi:PKD repeat protein
MKKLIRYLSFICIIGITLFQSCTKEPVRPVFPLSATIFHSIVGKQVAYTALTHSAVSWQWDFGDGQTSSEENPVHVYNVGGYYQAILTATDANGNSAADTVNLALDLSTINYLTGNPNEPGYKGKTWRLTTNHSANGDYLANADATFTTVDPSLTPLPAGIFGQIGFGDIYKDEFTFYYDGSYQHDVKDDGASFGGLVYQLVTNGGVDILNLYEDYGLCIAKYTPEEGATFTLTENEDFVVPSVYGPPTYMITYKGVSTLDFSGTEFVGFRDFQRKVIINKISDTSMQLIMFMAASPDYLDPVAFNTNALILSFEVVK